MAQTEDISTRFRADTSDFKKGTKDVVNGLDQVTSKANKSMGILDRATRKIGKMFDPSLLLSGLVGGLTAGGLIGVMNSLGNVAGDVFSKAFEAAMQNKGFASAMEGLNNAVAQLGAALAPTLIELIPLIQMVSQAIVDLANAVYIVTGVIFDDTASWQTKFMDLFNWLMGAIVDVVQSIIGALGELYKGGIDIMNKLAEGMANLLIDGINAGINGIISGINGLINSLKSLPLIGDSFKGVGNISFGGIGHISLEGGTKAAKDMADQFSKFLIDTLEKGQKNLGWDQSLGDLAKRYGLNMNYFTPSAKSLTTSMDNLRDTVEKNKLSQTVEINVHQVIEGTYSPEQLKALEDTTYTAINTSLRDRGLGA